MADNVAITAGTGTSVATKQLASGDHHQIVRTSRANAETDGSWTVTTTGSASVIAADATCTGITIINAATGRVFLRFDATIPTGGLTAGANQAHMYLEASERYEVPDDKTASAISFCGAAAGGSVLYHISKVT